MDVLDAAWRAAGSPVPDLEFGRSGSCARCGRSGLVTTTAVVSDKWTGWSDWRSAVRPALCAGCAWGYREPAHREGGMLVTGAPSAVALDPAGLVRALSDGLAPDQAVVLPLHRGRKHVLPTAAWGRLNVDDAALPWTEADVRRLQVVIRLRHLGVSGAALTRQAPPFRVLTGLTATQRSELLQLWPELDPWRPTTPWLAAAGLIGGMYCAAAA